MAKKIYGLIVIIIFAAMLSVPTLIWGTMLIAGGESFVETNIAAQLGEEEQRKPMTFADVFKGKTNEDGTVEPFSLNDLTANLEALYNDYAPFRAKLITVKRSVTTTVEKPYEQKIKPALIELWYSDEGGGNTNTPTDTVPDINDILGGQPGGDTDDPIGGPGGACEHEYVDAVTEPTCTEQGFTTHTCSKCNDFYTDSYVDAKGHDYEDVVTKPSCTEKGYTTHTCRAKDCGDSYTDTYVERVGHSSANWVTDKAATATAEGKRHKVCDTCGTSFHSEVVPATSHHFSNYVYNNDALCIEDGTETAKCDDAGCNVKHTRYKEGTAKGHKYTEKTVKPTCTERGYVLHTCSVCNDSYKDAYVDATGHDLEKKVVAPTCTEQGYTLNKCKKNCGYEKKSNFVSAAGHKYEYITDVVASCGVSGVRHKECSVCHDELESERSPMLTHSGSTVIKTVAATYEDAGYTLKKCDKCGREYRDNIVAKLVDTSIYPITYAGDGIIGRIPNSNEPAWLFYKTDVTGGWYKGGSYAQSGIESNYNNIKPLLEYCESKGIKLVIAAWPNKTTVYSEYMPTVDGGKVTPGSKMKGYIDGINAIDPRVHGVFPVDELKAYNNYFQTYFKYDTHWNMAGAYIGVQSIYKAIGYETTDLRLIPVTAVSPSLGNDYYHNGNRLDLIGIVGYQKTKEFGDDLCYDINYRPEVTYKEYMYDSEMQVTQEDPAMFIGGETTKTFSDNARYGKIVFVGDSFRNYVRPFLAKDFKETTVLHYNNISHVAEELRELGEGDVLVISRVERAGAMHDTLAQTIYNIVK